MKFNQYEGMQTENNLRLSFQSESSVSGTELRDRKKKPLVSITNMH